MSGDTGTADHGVGKLRLTDVKPYYDSNPQILDSFVFLKKIFGESR